MTISKAACDAAKKHAREVFPEESCGFVVGDTYLPVRNIAADPSTHREDPDCPCRLCSFEVSREDTLEHLPRAQLLIHSHPNGPVFPSLADMEKQIESGIPWAIIALDESRVGEPEIWGDNLVPPIVGREFLHGVRDCYTLIRDVYRIGRDALAAEGIKWPFAPIELPEFPRPDAWWELDDFDFYNIEPFRIGFTEIPREQAAPGDVFLCKIRSEKFNHAGVLIGGHLILHHLPARLSRKEPAGLWTRAAGRWLRYAGPEAIVA